LHDGALDLHPGTVLVLGGVRDAFLRVYSLVTNRGRWKFLLLSVYWNQWFSWKFPSNLWV